MDDFKMFLVIAMEARALQAKSVNEAAAWVAKELGKSGFRLPGGRYPKAATLIGWRKKLRGRMDARSYKEILRLGSDQPDPARFMLDGALKFHAQRN